MVIRVDILTEVIFSVTRYLGDNVISDTSEHPYRSDIQYNSLTGDIALQL